MPILETIKKRCVLEETLAFAGQVCSFTLTFTEAFSQQETENIRRGIEDLALRPVADGQRCFMLDKTDEGLVLTETGKESISFPFADEHLAALRWVIFGLVTGAPWVLQLEGKKVSASLYNSDQQMLAASILDAARRWQNGTASLEAPLGKIVASVADEFVGKGPRLVLQPVEKEVWNEFDYTFLPTKRSVEGRELLRQLYGGRNFEKEIEDYSHYIKSLPAYREELTEAKQRICRVIYNQPITGLKNALHTAQQDIVEACREKLPDKPPMRAQIQFSKLSGDAVGIAFSDLNTWYEKYLELKVVEAILADVVEWSETALQDEIYRARMAIQDINNELGSFCVVTTGAPKLDIGWEQSFALDEMHLRQKHTVWTSSMLYEIQIRSMYSDLWLVNPELAESVQAEYKSRTFGVPSLSEQTVVVLRII